MSPNRPSRNQGSILVTAIFVMVVMSVIGLAIIRLTATANQNVVIEVYGQRALNAARAGLELKLAQAFPLAGNSAQCSQDATAITLTASGFENCQYQAQCQQQSVNFPDGDSGDYYQFYSVGSCQFDGQIISRSLSVDGLDRSGP